MFFISISEKSWLLSKGMLNIFKKLLLRKTDVLKISIF